MPFWSLVQIAAYVFITNNNNNNDFISLIVFYKSAHGLQVARANLGGPVNLHVGNI